MSKLVRALLRQLHSEEVVNKLAQSPMMRQSAQTAHSVVELAKDKTRDIVRRTQQAQQTNTSLLPPCRSLPSPPLRCLTLAPSPRFLPPSHHSPDVSLTTALPGRTCVAGVCCVVMLQSWASRASV